MAGSITHHGSERASWIVCALSCVLAVVLITRDRIAVEPFSLAVAATVMAFLAGAYVAYARWRPDPLLSQLSGALAVISFSGAMAGIVSLVGLRYGAPMIDARLAALDHALGFDTPAMVRWAAASPLWSRLFGLAYDSSFPLLIFVMIVLALTKRFETLWRLAFVFSATILACTALSVIFPARGAFAYFGYGADILDALPRGAGIYHLDKFDYYRNAPAPVISFANLSGVVTFPSFHTCLALATIVACAGIRWLFIPSLIWNALVIASTVPIGGHYAIDIAAGAALWLAVSRAAPALARRDAQKPTRLVPQRALSPS